MPGRKSGNQGEGDRESARRFNEAQQKFVDSPEGEEAIAQAGELSESEREEAEQAEDEAASRAREKDPAGVRDYHKPAG